MRVSDHSISVEKMAADLNSMQERLRATLGIEHSAWASVLRLTTKEYAKVLSGKKPLTVLSLFAISERFSLSIELMMQNRLDYAAVVEHQAGNLAYLPERYTVAAFSKRRTAVNFLGYIENTYGWRLRSEALRHFQMTEASFSDPDATINVQFLTDLMGFLRKRGLSDKDFFEIGAHSLVTNRKSLLGEALCKKKSPSQVYETMTVELISFFERNCSYRLARLTEDSCVLESHSNSDVASALRVKHLGSVDGCLQRAGILASAPGYIGLPRARVFELTCVHRGDSKCRFKVDFGQAAWSVKHGAGSTRH